MRTPLRSSRHDLADLDYEQRVIGAVFRDYPLFRVTAAPLAPEHFAHPNLARVFQAIRLIEADGKTPSIRAVQKHLVARRYSSAISMIDHCVEHYIASADGHQLHLFVGRILQLAELRWLLALADRMDLALEDRRLDGSARIEKAHKAMREGFAKLGVEARRSAA
jgi:replicative DNA helicase